VADDELDVSGGDRASPGVHSGWLTRNLVVLSAVSFLQDTASELLYPILPIFLTTVLGAPVAAVGAVEGLGNGLAAASGPVSGRIADAFGRRPLVATGYGLAALGKAVIALATLWPVVLVGRGVDRVGKGIRGAPRDALIADGAPPEARGRAFGFQRAADTAGAVVGPLLGLAGYELLHHHLRPLLWLAVVPAVLSTLLVAAVHEQRRARRPRRHAAGAPRDPTRRADPLPAGFWRVTIVLGAFSLVNFPDALLLLRLRAIGFSVVAVILAYVAYNVVYAALSYPAGALSDRVPHARIYGVGLLFFALGYLGLGVVHSHTLALVLLAAYGTFTACTDGVGKAWVSSLVDPDHQARAQGWFQGLAGAAVLAAGLWAGLAWGHRGTVPLLVSGAGAAAIGVWLLSAPDPRHLAFGPRRRSAARSPGPDHAVS